MGPPFCFGAGGSDSVEREIGAEVAAEEGQELVATASISGGMRQVTGYTVESGITSGATVYYILVTADNGAATEGPMGDDSSGAARTADSYCNH